MPPRILLYHFLGLLSSPERCPWLNGQPTIPITSILSEWPKILIANPKSSAWKTHDLLQYFRAGIKETDKVRAPKRPVTLSKQRVFIGRQKKKHTETPKYGDFRKSPGEWRTKENCQKIYELKVCNQTCKASERLNENPGCKESQFYSLPFGQTVVTMY